MQPDRAKAEQSTEVGRSAVTDEPTKAVMIDKDPE